jgi:NADPH:quinone reductase-like Zn-dependent oxidoreductase
VKAFCVIDSAATAGLAEEEIPVPQPGQDELLIRVRAAGVTPTELRWYPTTHRKDGETRHRAVPGHEFSGVVAAVGGNVDVTVGQEIYGMNDWFADGAMSEYCVTQPSSVAPKPLSLTHSEAASVPIGALTAWQGLIDRAKLRAGGAFSSRAALVQWECSRYNWHVYRAHTWLRRRRRAILRS